MSVFSDRITAALDTLRGVAGEAVTYRQGATSVNVAAAKALSAVRMERQDGSASLATDEQDWGIDRATLAAANITPARGDTIERTIGGRTLTYTVLPPDNNRQPWDWVDPNGQTEYRIFTKLTSKA